MRIYQSENVLARELGVIKTVKLTTHSVETTVFEGTKKQIDAEGKRLANKPNALFTVVTER